MSDDPSIDGADAGLPILSVDTCPICRSSSFRPLTLTGLRRCRSCRGVSASSRADPDAVFRDGYHDGKTGAFGSDYRRLDGYLKAVNTERVQQLDRYVPGRGTLLDVGCGGGHFLEAARDAGWTTIGLEPVASTAEQARTERGVEVINATLETSGLPEHSFDCVSLIHVLEHMEDTQAFLDRVLRLVKPGGHVFIEVPNYGSMLRRRSGESWMHLRPLEHVVQFDSRSLRRALSRASLRPVTLSSTSYVGKAPGLRPNLNVLGLSSLERRLVRFDRSTPNDAQRPSLGLLRLLLAVERAYDLARRGMVLTAVAQVR